VVSRMHARTQQHVSSAILFPFSFIVALPPLFAEHQHHLLFARSIYSVNYIYLCSQYTAVVRQLRFYIFFLFYFILFYFFTFTSFLLVHFSRSCISLAIWYSTWFTIPSDIASRVACVRRPTNCLCQTFTSPRAVNFRFIRLSFTFPLIAGVRVQARNNAFLSYQLGAPFFISVLFRRAISHARELYITSLI